MFKLKQLLKGQSGLTLIELLIALFLMLILTVFSARALKSGLTSQTKIRDRSELVNQVRATLRVMQKDINLAFHQHDLSYELEAAIAKGTTTNQTNQQNNQNAQNEQNENNRDQTTTNSNQKNKLREKPPQYTQFWGTEDSLNFTTTTHIRMQKDVAESDQMEVGYFLKDCKSLSTNKNSNCLWRRTSPLIDKDTDKDGGETVLLEYIEKLEFQYYGQDQTEWTKTWRTDETGEATMRDIFPEYVRIFIKANNGLTGKKKRTVAMTMMATVRFPNNKAKATEEDNKETTGSTTKESTPQPAKETETEQPPPPPPEIEGGEVVGEE